MHRAQNALTSSRISRRSAGANDRRSRTQINLICTVSDLLELDPATAPNGGSARVLPGSLVAQPDVGIGRRTLRAAVTSCALATWTVPADFTATFPDMAVRWGFGPLDDAVLVSISSPGLPGMSGHAAGVTVTREPLSHGPDRNSGRVRLRCSPGRPIG